MAKHKLQRLLFTQGGKCFYCRNHLKLEDAMIDHIIPSSQGGSDLVENLAACCKQINQLFGNASVKMKLETLILWGGSLPCPNRAQQEMQSHEK